MKKNLSQLRAISYCYSQKLKSKRQSFIIDKEGGLQNFFDSPYKTEYWYIRSKYGVLI